MRKGVPDEGSDFFFQVLYINSLSRTLCGTLAPLELKRSKAQENPNDMRQGAHRSPCFQKRQPLNSLDRGRFEADPV